jgi:hypothetical protein
MFSYVSLEERVPQDHPLRAIRRITDRALERLSPRFGTLYVNFGRPSIPPEKLLRAPGGGNPTVNFQGQRRRNATHQSATDPDARLYTKARGREAHLGYLGHVLMEHRSHDFESVAR